MKTAQVNLAGRLAVILVALAIFGCKGSVQTSAASGGDGSSSGASGDGAAASSSSGGGFGSATQVDYIKDPSLGMNAISVTIPANWKFDSVFLQGGTCAPTPFGVFRAVSPDGQSMVERMPTLAWQWGQGPMAGYASKTDCLPMQKPMSAQEFLKYMADTMKMHYDGDLQVPAAEEEKAQKSMADAQAAYAGRYAASHIEPPKQQRQLARAAVSYNRGSMPMKGVLDVVVDCTETKWAGQQTLSAWTLGHPGHIVQGQGSVTDKCLASVTYFTAPDAKIDGLMRQWDAPGMGTKPMDDWVQAWINRSERQSEERISAMNTAAAAQREASHEQFEHSMAVQQQMHNQFMQTMQDNHEHFMAGQAANMQARETSTSDWVDFALDRQTVLNTNTGEINKMSNQVTVGGALQQVHGNGTPW
jgi:hypothetical protein